MILFLFWWTENMHYARCLKIQENKKGGINENKVYTGNIDISHEWMLYGILCKIVAFQDCKLP